MTHTTLPRFGWVWKWSLSVVVVAVVVVVALGVVVDTAQWAVVEIGSAGVCRRYLLKMLLSGCCCCCF